MRNKIQCPLCDKIFTSKPALYEHIETTHPEQVKTISPAQLYFNYRNHYNLEKGYGKCIMCGGPTKFNEQSERYERLCTKQSCKEKYREMFRERMKKKGKDPDTFLNDPDQQKKMLEHRKISGTYTWSDGKTKTKYTGSYEKDFLTFVDLIMHWENPNDIMMPAPQIIDYKFNGKDHFYIPDVYITSLNLLIEIKSKTNNHYRLRDIDQEKAKDKKVKELKYNYIKIYDKKYAVFFNWLIRYREKLENSDSTNLIITETFNPFE